jgi:hypothetical protein
VKKSWTEIGVRLKKGYEEHYEHLEPAVVEADGRRTLTLGSPDGLTVLAQFRGPGERCYQCLCGEMIVLVEDKPSNRNPPTPESTGPDLPPAP